MPTLRWSLSVLVLVLVGCGGAERPSDSDPAQQDRAKQAATQQEAAQTKSSASDGPQIKEVTHADAMDVVEQSGATVTVINFWATWCVPCVEEFPSFVKLDRRLDDRGVDVMFISTDFPDQKQKVATFLADHGVTGTSYLKTGNTTTFVNGFSEDWSGAVPATFVYDGEGTLLDFWEGKVSYQELKQRVTEQLDQV
jgi:thiol-disulfide isomerase/thioredoxin